MKSIPQSSLGRVLVECLIIWPHRVFSLCPTVFLVLSLALSVSLGVPLLYTSCESDADFLFGEASGTATNHLRQLSRDFPMNTSFNFDEARVTKYERFARVVLHPKDGKTIFRPEVFRDILEVDQVVNKVIVTHDGLEYGYHRICSKNRGRCYRNPLLDFSSRVHSIEQGIYNVKFPAELNMHRLKFHYLGQSTGDVEVDDKGNLKSALYGGLIYYLDSTNSSMDVVLEKWQKAVYVRLEAMSCEHVDIMVLTRESVKTEINNMFLYTLYMLVPSVGVFMVIMATMGRMSLSGILLLIMVSVTALLAVLSGIGLAVFVLGTQFSMVQMAFVATIIVMALVDALVLEDVWKNESYKGQEEVLRSMGLSILVTFLGCSTLYGMSCLVPVHAPQISAVAWASTIVFWHFYQILVYTWWMPLTVAPVEEETQTSTSDQKEQLILPWTSSSKKIPEEFPFLKPEEDSSETKTLELQPNGEEVHFSLMSTEMCSRKAKTEKLIPCLVGGISLWLGYMALACCGIQFLGYSMEPETFYPPNSKTFNLMVHEKKYFGDFFYRVHVVVDHPMEYWKPEVQKMLQELIDDNPYTTLPVLNESWLKYYLIFLKDPRSRIFSSRYNTTSPQGFIKCLRQVFFRIPLSQRFIPDVMFNENFTQIAASRFFVHGYQIRGSVEGLAFMTKLREFGKGFPSLKPYFYNFLDPIQDIQNRILWVAFSSAIAVTLVILFFTFILTGSIYISLLLALTMLGLQIGVLSCFALWGVDLNAPAFVALNLFFGMMVKFIASILPAINRPLPTLMRLISGIIGMVTGISIVYFLKSFTMVTDHILIMICIVTLVHLLFFAPLLVLYDNPNLLRLLKISFVKFTSRFLSVSKHSPQGIELRA